MQLDQLKQLVIKGESNVLEFKKSTATLQATFETICAFLNGSGGVVLIGVNDKGLIVGQDVADSTRKAIANEITKLEPPVHIKIDYLLIDKSKVVIALEVLPGKHVPYVYDGRAYHRLESTTERMPQHKYDQLLLTRNQLNYSWEKSFAKNYRIEMLDKNILLGVVRTAVETKRLPEIALKQDIPKILESLELVEGTNVKNAAVVLFGTKFPADYFQCELQLARFKGLTRSEFLDSNNELGNVFNQLDAGMLFVSRHLPIAARIEAGKLERVETPIIPFDAIREALINALTHRDYSINGSSIKLAIYDDRMEISSHGGLPPGVTLKMILSGYSKRRNPIIAEVLYKAGLIEKWGRGIREMISKCKLAGDPEPEFDISEAEFKVVFPFPRSLKPEFILSEEVEKVELTERQRKILEILSSDGKLKTKDILTGLNHEGSDRMVRYDLNCLKEKGLVESEGSTKMRVWFIRK